MDIAQLPGVSHVVPTIIVLVSLLLGGCVTVSVGGNKKDPDFEMATPAGGWEEIRSLEVARAYRSKVSGAVLGVSSACDDVTRNSYDALLDAVTAAVPERRVTQTARDLTAGNFPGKVLSVQGRQGAAPLEMMAIVMKSSHCVYDVTLTGRSLAGTDKDQAMRVARSIKEKPL